MIIFKSGNPKIGFPLFCFENLQSALHHNGSITYHYSFAEPVAIGIVVLVILEELALSSVWLADDVSTLQQPESRTIYKKSISQVPFQTFLGSSVDLRAKLSFDNTFLDIRERKQYILVHATYELKVVIDV